MAPRKTTPANVCNDSPIPIGLTQQRLPGMQPHQSMEQQPAHQLIEHQPAQQRPRCKTAYTRTYNVDDLIQKNTFLAREYTQFDGHSEPQAMALLAAFEANEASDKRVPATYNQARKSEDWPK